MLIFGSCPATVHCLLLAAVVASDATCPAANCDTYHEDSRCNEKSTIEYSSGNNFCVSCRNECGFHMRDFRRNADAETFASRTGKLTWHLDSSDGSQPALHGTCIHTSCDEFENLRCFAKGNSGTPGVLQAYTPGDDTDFVCSSNSFVPSTILVDDVPWYGSSNGYTQGHDHGKSMMTCLVEKVTRCTQDSTYASCLTGTNMTALSSCTQKAGYLDGNHRATGEVSGYTAQQCQTKCWEDHDSTVFSLKNDDECMCGKTRVNEKNMVEMNTNVDDDACSSGWCTYGCATQAPSCSKLSCTSQKKVTCEKICRLTSSWVGHDTDCLDSSNGCMPHHCEGIGVNK